MTTSLAFALGTLCGGTAVVAALITLVIVLTVKEYRKRSQK